VIVRARTGRVGVDIAGEGTPLLLLHGFPHDRSLWRPQLAGGLAGVRCIAPDLPGFGESDPIEAHSLDAWADWAAALLDTLEIPRAIVGGLSMGGYLTFALWRRHPGRIGALVLAATKAGADTDEGRTKRREMKALVEREGVAPAAERMMPGMVGKTSREIRPEVVTELDAMMRRASPAAVAAALDALMARPDSTPTLGTIDVPTLILCGDEDVLTPLAESQAMHAAIAGSELGVLRGAGHVCNVEDPATFNGLLSRFLTATIRRTTSSPRTTP
jgi:pimeloyl-ACP methyl ester carboxylesterase